MLFILKKFTIKIFYKMVGFKTSIKRRILILIGLKEQNSIAPYQRIKIKQKEKKTVANNVYKKLAG